MTRNDPPIDAAAPRQQPVSGPAIFHLSLPVRSLDASRAFYCDLLGAPLGRQSQEWIDVMLFGHQLTLHARPEEVGEADEQGVRHFGAILPWMEWQALAARLRDAGAAFAVPPATAHAGTPAEQAKMLLRDPSGHLLEIKAYRDIAAVFAGQSP